MILYMSSVAYMYLTAPVLAWRGWHSDCLGRACRQSGQRHHLRHPEELPVLSARAGLQYWGGRDHEWAGLLHAGWGLVILSILLNGSQRCPNKGETCSVTCIYSIGQKLYWITHVLVVHNRRYKAGILPRQRKTQNNQSILYTRKLIISVNMQYQNIIMTRCTHIF